MQKDDLIEAASMPGRGEGCGFIAGGLPDDIFDTYERYKQQEREQIKESVQYLAELTSKQETMNRIMTCIHILPTEEHQVIMGLYGPGQYYSKDSQEISKDYGMSVPTLKRIRRRAMSRIMELYKLGYSQEELYRFDIETGTLRSYR